LKICFITGVALFGAERQTLELAKILSEWHEVRLIGVTRHGEQVPGNWSELKSDIVEFDTGLDSLIPRHVSLTRKLRELRPDVCIQRSVGVLTGLVAVSCRLINSRFIYHSATNWDSRSQLILWLSPSPVSLFYYQMGLSLADAVVAQTKEIAEQFERKFMGFKRVAIVPQVYDALTVSVPHQKEPFVLWLGRMVWYKHPELFVELAKSLGEIRFVMAGSGPLLSAIESRAKGVANLTILGSVNHDLAEELCGKAQVFVNTSMIEGFPNTLLESAARETPYVSLQYDPDGVICSYRIGLHSRSFRDLVGDVSHLMNDRSLRAELGKNGRKYVLENHTPTLAADAYCHLIESLRRKQ